MTSPAEFGPSGFADAIEAEWAPDAGFFWRLREGVFDPDGFDRTLAALKRVRLSEDEQNVDRRLVSVIWFAPLFMEWQESRLREGGADIAACRAARNAVFTEVQRILGLP